MSPIGDEGVDPSGGAVNVKNTQHILKRKTLFLVSVLSPLFEYRFIRNIYYILSPEGDEGGGQILGNMSPKKVEFFWTPSFTLLDSWMYSWWAEYLGFQGILD